MNGLLLAGYCAFWGGVGGVIVYALIDTYDKLCEKL